MSAGQLTAVTVATGTLVAAEETYLHNRYNGAPTILSNTHLEDARRMQGLGLTAGAEHARNQARWVEANNMTRPPGGLITSVATTALQSSYNSEVSTDFRSMRNESLHGTAQGAREEQHDRKSSMRLQRALVDETAGRMWTDGEANRRFVAHRDSIATLREEESKEVQRIHQQRRPALDRFHDKLSVLANSPTTGQVARVATQVFFERLADRPHNVDGTQHVPRADVNRSDLHSPLETHQQPNSWTLKALSKLDQIWQANIESMPLLSESVNPISKSTELSQENPTKENGKE